MLEDSLEELVQNTLIGTAERQVKRLQFSNKFEYDLCGGRKGATHLGVVFFKGPGHKPGCREQQEQGEYPVAQFVQADYDSILIILLELTLEWYMLPQEFHLRTALRKSVFHVEVSTDLI